MIKEKIKQLSNQNKSVLINMFGAFAVKGCSLVLSLFTMPVYIRFFQNQTVLGVWFTIISVLNWIMYFDLGLGNGLRNKLPEAIESKDGKLVGELISTTYIIMSAVVLVLCLAGAIILKHINWNSVFNVSESLVNRTVLTNCVLIVYFGILIQFITRLVTSILFAIQKSAIVNLMSLISSLIIVLALVIVPSSSIEKNLYTMAIVNVVAMTLPGLVATLFVLKKLINRLLPKLSCFRMELGNDIFKIGISLLWLQIVFMVISSTNDFLISYLVAPAFVVEYQAYFKIFNTGAMVFSLALTPIWSAVTKAQAKKDYYWIKKVYGIFLRASILCLLLELAIVPFLQKIMNLWLGAGTIKVTPLNGLIFAFSGTVFVLHSVNTSIGNGISYFKIQIVWMTFAAVVFIPLSYLMVKITGNWIGMIIANVISLLPYEILAPAYTLRLLNMKTESYK